MENKKLSIIELKNIIFSYEYSKAPYLADFYGNPYTFIKSKYYMYCSVALVYVLLKTRIKPNAVTIAYVLCGIATAILLAIPNVTCNVAAVIIAFNKGILDWSDGHLARLKYEPSLTGHLLDEYGASINSIGFFLGLGFFAMHQSNYELLIYLIPATMFLYAEKYQTVSSVGMINGLSEFINCEKNRIKPSEGKTSATNKEVEVKKGLNLVWGRTFGILLDGRARSVDFISLIILMDIYFGIALSFYVFSLVFLGILIKFILSLVLGVRHKWAEQVFENCNSPQNNRGFK